MLAASAASIQQRAFLRSTSIHPMRRFRMPEASSTPLKSSRRPGLPQSIFFCSLITSFFKVLFQSVYLSQFACLKPPQTNKRESGVKRAFATCHQLLLSICCDAFNEFFSNLVPSDPTDLRCLFKSSPKFIRFHFQEMD